MMSLLGWGTLSLCVWGAIWSLSSFLKTHVHSPLTSILCHYSLSGKTARTAVLEKHKEIKRQWACTKERVIAEWERGYCVNTRPADERHVHWLLFHCLVWQKHRMSVWMSVRKSKENEWGTQSSGMATKSGGVSGSWSKPDGVTEVSSVMLGVHSRRKYSVHFERICWDERCYLSHHGSFMKATEEMLHVYLGCNDLGVFLYLCFIERWFESHVLQLKKRVTGFWEMAARR